MLFLKTMMPKMMPMSNYSDIIDRVQLAELTGSPVVLLVADGGDDESRITVDRVSCRTHEVIGMIRWAEHVVKNQTVCDG